MTVVPRRTLLAAIVSVSALGLVAGGALSASAATYPASNSSIGRSSTDAWTASAADAASVVAEGDGEALRINAGGGVTHNLATNAYPLLDNVLPAQLPWKNVFSGAVNARVDPATGLELPTSGASTVDVKLSAGATLFVDATLAYGATADSLDTVALTCELPATTGWSTVNINTRCYHQYNPGRPDAEVNWMVTEDWTYADDWDGTSTYAAGDYLLAYGKASPIVAYLSGVGFRVEGDAGASALIDNVDIRDQSIDFSAAATTSTLTATTLGAAVPGAAVTVRAVVSPASAAGSFVVKDGGSILGQGATVNGVFTLTTTSLAVGSHPLSAVFTPTDAASFVSSSTATTIAINEKKTTPVDPPAATIEELLADPDVVVTPPSAFEPATGEDSNPIDALDAGQPLSGEIPWIDDSDSFVDVYGYSKPIFLGTFPVVNGRVQLSGLDLSALAVGGHHLVFVGQTSEVSSAMAVTVASGAAAHLAATGFDAVSPLMLGGILLLVGIGALLMRRLGRI
jgi:hypothetical protein